MIIRHTLIEAGTTLVRCLARRLGALAIAAMSTGVMIGAVGPAHAQSGKSPTVEPPGAAAPAVAGEAGARRVVLRFVTTNDFPPFNYLDEDGVLTGFNVDLARAICLELGVPCDVGTRAWEDLNAALGRKQADAVIAGQLVTARALATVEFTDRYFHTPGRFVGRRDGPALEITPDGLDSRKIGVTKGTTHEAYLQAFFRDSAIQRFETQDLARDALMAGKIDLVFDDGVGLVLWLNGTLSKECCELKGGPYLEPKYFGDGIAIAVAKSDWQLRGDLNGALKRLKTSGRFEELVLRYFPYRVF